MSTEYMKKIHVHAGATSCYNKNLTLLRILVANKLVGITIITIIAACKRAGRRNRTVWSAGSIPGTLGRPRSLSKRTLTVRWAWWN